MKEIDVKDMENIFVGNAEYEDGPTGCSVIISEKGFVAGVDVRGGSPGTRETDLLRPENMIEKIHAVFLTGGSAYGLDCASGIMEFLEEKNIGFDTGLAKVPIVSGAVLYDLNTGNSKIRPDKELGYRSCKNAYKNNFRQGSYGAGIGASVGKLYGMDYSMKGAIGAYGLEVDGLKVLSIVAVNALGDVIDSQTNNIVAGLKDDEKGFLNTEREMMKNYNSLDGFLGQNTTIGAVITNAAFDKAQMNKIASMTHDGFARAIRPSHSFFDGDTIFSLSTGEISADINIVGMLSSITMEKAIVSGIRQANNDRSY